MSPNDNDDDNGNDDERGNPHMYDLTDRGSGGAERYSNYPSLS